MKYKVDYHVHSYYSDGTMKPTDLVRKYKDDEYDMIAITDHDGIDGLMEAKIAGEALQIQVIPGIELSTAYEDFHGEALELHMLGYNIDSENPDLVKRLEAIKQERKVRNEKLLKVINDMGYELSYEDLLQRPGQTYIGKPNFARGLVKKGYISLPKEAFEEGRFLESPEAKKIKKVKISTIEAMDLIKGAGGISVLAHPMEIKGLGEVGSDEFFDNLDLLVRELKKNGLKGMEVFHPSANHEDSLKLADIAGKYHLHMTEGSDFHGDEVR